MTDQVNSLKAQPPLARLLSIMQALRDPENGCPWDKQQDFNSLIPYTIEEAYEVADAIVKGEPAAIQDELGDLLFQVVFYAQLGREQGWFGFDDIAEGVADKLIRRHPHVFADVKIDDSQQVKEQWEAIKRDERSAKSKGSASVFDDIPGNLPALMQALKMQKRCRSVGFDWDNIEDVSDKVTEELDEVRQELAKEDGDPRLVEEEIGDLLFAVVNLARHAKVNPESALRTANQKFMRRFQYIEAQVAAQNRTVDTYNIDELEGFWQQAKQS